MRISAAAARTLMLLAAVLASGCVTRTVGEATPEPAVGPPMVIERFLRAANQNDLDTMASLFGTQSGSVTRTWNAKELDDRMLMFANLLRHSDYNIGPEQVVSGRRNEATQYTVRMVIDEATYQVPFTLVRSRDAHWLIENIGILAITRGTGQR